MKGEAGTGAVPVVRGLGCPNKPREPQVLTAGTLPGLCASGPSRTGQGGGTRQAGSQAQVLYISPPSSGLMTGRRQVGARPRPGACTCVAGPKAVADVPGIPTPDAKLLAGCRAGGSRVFYIMRACLLPHGLLEPPVVRASFSRGVRNPAYVSVGQSPAPAASSLSLSLCSV